MLMAIGLFFCWLCAGIALCRLYAGIQSVRSTLLVKRRRKLDALLAEHDRSTDRWIRANLLGDPSLYLKSESDLLYAEYRAQHRKLKDEHWRLTEQLQAIQSPHTDETTRLSNDLIAELDRITSKLVKLDGDWRRGVILVDGADLVSRTRY